MSVFDKIQYNIIHSFIIYILFLFPCFLFIFSDRFRV